MYEGCINCRPSPCDHGILIPSHGVTLRWCLRVSRYLTCCIEPRIEVHVEAIIIVALVKHHTGQLIRVPFDSGEMPLVQR